MAENKIIYINHNNKYTSLQVVPRSPVLSSYREGWKNICIEYHHQPPHETPNYLSSNHGVIIIDSKNPIANEQRLDGCLRRDSLGDGDTTIIPAGIAHSGVWYEEFRAIYIVLEPAYIANIAPEAIYPDRLELLPRFAGSDPLLYQIGLTLKTELELETFDGNLYIDALSNAVGMHLIYKYGSNKLKIKQYVDGLSKAQLDRVLEYVNEHLQEEIKLVDLAQIAGMGQYYFSNLFKKSMGIAPYQYVIKQRVNKAKRLLKQTDLSILEVALECGFNHASHLSRHFTRLVGVSPKVFRNK